MNDERVPGAEEQESLLEPEDREPDWKQDWKGLPEYRHADEEPEQSIYVHFKTVADRENFAQLVGQRITSSTKFIWYPKAAIGTAADKVWTGAKGNPRHPVYVISKGRADTRLTSKAFEFAGIPYKIVIEPQELNDYAAVIDRSKILVLPFSNLGLGGIPARNWVWNHAAESGATHHWIFDDNISGFCRFHDNLKVEVDSGILHKMIEDFVDRYDNLVMAAFNYDYFAPRKQGAKIKPITFNTRCYSGILLRNDIVDVNGEPIRWRGRYNEDTDLSLRILKDGATRENDFRGRYTTALFNAFLMYKKPTLTMKGGNTDQLYAGVEAAVMAFEEHANTCKQCAQCLEGYTSKVTPCDVAREILKADGRWLMAESLREQHPDVTTVERKWRRWQHQVDYRRFIPNPLVLREGAIIPDGDDFGMTLGAMPDDGVIVNRPALNFKPGQTTPLIVPPATKPAAGPSALDFASVPARPEQPVGAASSPEPPRAIDMASPAVQAEPIQPTVAPPAFPEAQKLRDDLLDRGHRLIVQDGKLFRAQVKGAEPLTDDDKVNIRRLKPELLLVCDVMPQTVVEAPPVEQSGLFIGSAPGAVEFIGKPSAAQDANWRPDELPDLAGVTDIVLNFATNGLRWDKGDKPVGLTVSTLDGQLTRFLPFGFEYGGNHDEETVKRWAKEQLRGKKITNSKTKFDCHMSRVWGVDLEEQGCTFSDIQHTAALLDDHRKRFALDVLAAEYLPDLPTVARLDESRHSQQHASDVAERERFTAQLVAKLTAKLQPQIDEQELRVVHDLEDSVINPVVEMERNGAPLDLELLDAYGKQCSTAHDTLMWEIARECGFAFEHTANGWTRLLESLHLPIPDAFDEATLNGVDHPLIRKGQKAAQYDSLNSKIFCAYKEQVGDDGILRFEINQLRGDDGGTVSGRFSIGYVQQVPNHDNHHAAFGAGDVELCAGLCAMFPRRLFRSLSGTGYLAIDAEQIEYRLLVHYAKNAAMLEAYRKNPRLSYHKETWARMKAYKPDMVYSHQKNFNFARQYGAKSVKLAVMMKFITEREGEEIRRAKRWDDPRLNTIHEIERAYSKMMPEGDELLARAAHLAKPACDDYCKTNDKLHRTTEHKGFVKTYLGRRSRFPTNYKTYIGLNRVIQGTGADIMKKKLVELHAERKVTGFLMRMTVHDEIGGDNGDAGTLARVSEICNRQSYPLRVPILWAGKTGQTWADCK